jgi:hypothetical protein
MFQNPPPFKKRITKGKTKTNLNEISTKSQGIIIGDVPPAKSIEEMSDTDQLSCSSMSIEDQEEDNPNKMAKNDWEV